MKAEIRTRKYLKNLPSASGLEGVDDLEDPLQLAGDFPLSKASCPFRGNVESIAVYEKTGHNQYLALAVTDDDSGGSEWLQVEIEI